MNTYTVTALADGQYLTRVYAADSVKQAETFAISDMSGNGFEWIDLSGDVKIVTVFKGAFAEMSTGSDKCSLFADAMKERHAERIAAFLSDVSMQLKGSNEVDDYSDSEWQWNIRVKDIDISVIICESMEHEGIDEGCNISLGIVNESGEILGEITPYNYSPQVWTLDSSEFAERVEMTLNLDELVTYIKKHI